MTALLDRDGDLYKHGSDAQHVHAAAARLASHRLAFGLEFIGSIIIIIIIIMTMMTRDSNEGFRKLYNHGKGAFNHEIVKSL